MGGLGGTMEASEPGEQDGRILLTGGDAALGGLELLERVHELVPGLPGAHPEDGEAGVLAACLPTGRRAAPWRS